VNLARWLLEAARRHAGRPALLDEGGAVAATYADFAGRACEAASQLRECHGLGPGDRVVVFAHNSLEYLVTMFGTWWAGAVVVPVNVKLHERELATILGDCMPRLVITDDDALATVVAALDRVTDHPPVVGIHAIGRQPATRLTDPEARGEDDLAWVFYTSGTTGAPKGAMLSHGNLVAASLSYSADVTVVDPTTTYVYAAPMSHGAGLYAPVHVLMGARHLALTAGFDAEAVLRLAEDEAALSMFAAPTMVRRLTAAARAAGKKAPGLRTVVYGGGPMHLTDITEAIAWFGDRFVQIYGQGESPMTITVLRRDDHQAGETSAALTSVGRPHSVVDVRVVDESGAPVGSDEVGEIEVRGPTVMGGYWGDPDATARALRGGWLATGDLGSWDDAGFLTLRGRSKDVVITGGSNVYPREVEDVLLLHPRVQAVSVVGEPDPEWGEVVVAFVVPVPDGPIDGLLDELDRICLDSLARFKRPKRYVVVDELPENAYGKIVKRDLAARLAPATSASKQGSVHV